MSGHPVPALATGEVVGEVLEHMGTGPSVAVLALTSGHAGALEDAAGVVRTVLGPGVLIATVVAALAGERAADPATGAPAAGVGLWAARLGTVSPAEGRGLVLVRPPGAPSVGDGLVVAGSDHPVVLGDRLVTDHPVGLALGDDTEAEVVTVSGQRAVGPALTVTEADGRLVSQLDGRPAMDTLLEIARDRTPAGDIPLINRSLHVIGPTGADHRVRGRDTATGALVIEPPIPVGGALHFAVHDPAVVRDDAVDLLEGWDTALAWYRHGAGVAPGPAWAEPVLAMAAPLDRPAGDGEVVVVRLRERGMSRS